MLKEAQRKEEEEGHKEKGKEKVQTPPREPSLVVPSNPIFSYEDFEFYDQEQEIRRLKKENAKLKKEKEALTSTKDEVEERDLCTHIRLEKTLQKLEEWEELLEVLASNKLDKQQGEEMDAIK